MDVSVVVPLYNEEESLPELAGWISKVCQQSGISYEVIFVDDGSHDNSWQVIESLISENSHYKGIKFRRNYGKSAALNKGFEAASGEVVITMDADMQDSPDEIPGLVNMIHDENLDIVSGWKKKRHDPLGKTIPSKLFNRTTRYISGIKLHDFNCGLKAYRKEVIKNIEVYGEMHRYIPVIAKWAGFRRIGEKVVQHRARKYGVTKFGMERLIKGYLDLLTITFISKFGKRPMHLFGTMGSLVFFIGFMIGVYLSVEKYFYHVFKMTERPLFYLGLLAMVIGSQLFVTGFIAEMISRSSHDRNIYLVEKKSGF
ncbi:MAG: glycosyltransferase [Bacteroidales bacterium]|nr:glycosyltransferase [Bacteroidales bacterium]MCF8402399.1 glycosyltransferase [Bacteroidales bacterium]